MRLDLTTFAITGPSTLTVTVGKMVGGQVTDGVTTGKLFNYAGTCFTDSFTVSGAVGVPPLCGTLSGEHGMIIFCLISKTLLCLNIWKR